MFFQVNVNKKVVEEAIALNQEVCLLIPRMHSQCCLHGKVDYVTAVRSEASRGPRAIPQCRAYAGRYSVLLTCIDFVSHSDYYYYDRVLQRMLKRTIP